MAYNPNIHHRRSIRLKGYDYSQAGLYYITICVQNRVCLFGNVAVGAPLVGAQNVTNDCDKMDMGRPQGRAPTHDPINKTVGDILDAFKSITTVEYIRGVKTLDWPRFDKKLWQRDYWEHIIRDEQSYLKISEYIINNPKNWNTDKLK